MKTEQRVIPELIEIKIALNMDSCVQDPRARETLLRQYRTLLRVCIALELHQHFADDLSRHDIFADLWAEEVAIAQSACDVGTYISRCLRPIVDRSFVHAQMWSAIADVVLRALGSNAHKSVHISLSAKAFRLAETFALEEEKNRDK